MITLASDNRGDSFCSDPDWILPKIQPLTGLLPAPAIRPVGPDSLEYAAKIAPVTGRRQTEPIRSSAKLLQRRPIVQTAKRGRMFVTLYSHAVCLFSAAGQDRVPVIVRRSRDESA